MTNLYNRWILGQTARFPTPDLVAAALATGNWVATAAEVTPGTPPSAPPLPEAGGGGAALGNPFSIADLPAAAGPVGDAIWLPFLTADGGAQQRLTRAQLLAGVSAAAVSWGAVTGKPDSFPPSAHGHAFSQITNLPVILAQLIALQSPGYLAWDGNSLTTAAALVDWQALPQAISGTVTSTGGAGPSDTVPLLQWVSPDEGKLYGFGVRWRSDGRVDLFHRWNGVECTPISMPARTNLGGGAASAEFMLGGPLIPLSGGVPAQRGLLSIAWGSFSRFLRLLSPDSFDANALRLIFAGPSGETTNLRQFQAANSYAGWYNSAVYSAAAVATFAIQHSAATANGVQVTGADAGQSPALEAKGADPEINVVVKPKGGNGSLAVEAPAGGAAKIVASGPDASHDLALSPKGAGVLRLSPTVISGLTAVTAAAGTGRVMVHNGTDLVGLTVDQLFNGRLLQNSVLAGNLELKQGRVDVAASATLPVFGGQNVYHYRLTGSPVTLTLPARSPSSTRLLIIRVCIDQDATGGRALSFAAPAGEIIQWSGGSMGTIATAANARTWFEFRAIGGETRWDAKITDKD